MTYKCNELGCHRTGSSHRLAQHILADHRKRTSFCGVCKYKLSRIDALKRHRDYTSESGEGSCQECAVCGYIHKSGRARERFEKKCQGNCAVEMRKEMNAE